eukprot:266445_1
MIPLSVYLVSLLLLPLTQSVSLLFNGIWYDDFQQDGNKLTGWALYNGGVGSLGNPIIDGSTYRYHGPFTRYEDKTSSSMTRFFSCKRNSTLTLSFDYGYCKTKWNEDGI